MDETLQPKDTDWLNGNKNKTHIYAVYNKSTSDLKTHIDWKWEDGNGKQKKAGEAILISDKIDLKIKNIARDKEGHYIMFKGSIQEEDLTIVNNYAPNMRAPQYIRQTLTDIKGEIDSNTVIVGDFNTTLTPMDRSSTQKISKETQVLNDTLDEMDLPDIFRTFYPNAEESTFFSSAHGTFSRIEHILGHKSNLCKFKRTEIISSMFPNHNAMRLNISYKKINCKKHKNMEIKQYFSK